MLLILDNFEHLVDGAGFVSALLEGVKALRIVVTSRERLNLQDEVVYTLNGLAYPTNEQRGTVADDVRNYDAVKLLVQRAQLLAPDYTPGAEDLAAAARIARLVEGMPLALLLASSWLSLLTLQEIATEISADVDFLESEARDLPARQRSIRAIFEGSWKVLEAKERVILSRLSVFRGSFDQVAAQIVAGATAKDLLALIQKSWLQRSKDGRLHIHELLRQYAASKMQDEAASWQEIQRRHATYFADFLEEHLSKLRGSQQQKAYTQVKTDFDNVRMAWQWLVTQQSSDAIIKQMLPSLFRFCETRSESFSLFQLLETALSSFPANGSATGDVHRAVLLTALGAFFRNGYPMRFETFGMMVPAREDLVEEAWSLATIHGGIDAGFWDALLGYVHGRTIDREAGLSYVRQLLLTLPRSEKVWERAFALQVVALLTLLRAPNLEASHFQEVHDILSESLTIFQSLGDLRETAFCLRSLGQLHWLQRHFTEAIETWTTAQRQLEEIGEWSIAADIDWQIGDAHLQMGAVQEAFPYYSRMSEAYLKMGHKRVAAMVLSKESYEAGRYGKLAYALQRREKGLALARESGDVFGEAWSYWEMGELVRLQGETETARNLFSRARTLFEQFGDVTGIVFFYRGLGDLALARGRYEEAQRAFEDSLLRAEANNHKWAMAYALTGLGLAAIGLQRMEAAGQNVLQAVQLASETGDGGITLRALAVAARYFQKVGERERAIELATFVTAHPVSWLESKTLVRDLQPLERGVATSEDTETPSDPRVLWATVDRVVEALSATEPVRGRYGLRPQQ